MSTDLLSMHCEPVPSGTPPLSTEQLRPFAAQLADRWSVIEGHHLSGDFTFSDFLEALAFTNRAGEVAEAEGHHPEITLTWGRATVKIWTHSIDGLSTNDFILAARIDALS